MFILGGWKIKIKLTNVVNNPLDGTMKASLTSGYLSRSGFTAISIRMDPDSDYAIRTSILPLAEYPRRRARQAPDLCFAEMASSWLHPVFLYTDGSSNWMDFLRVSPPSGILFVAFSVRSSTHAPCCGCTDSEQLSGQPVRKDSETLPLDFYGQPIRKDNGTMRLVRPIATTRAQSVIGFTLTFLKDLRT